MGEVIANSQSGAAKQTFECFAGFGALGRKRNSISNDPDDCCAGRSRLMHVRLCSRSISSQLQQVPCRGAACVVEAAVQWYHYGERQTDPSLHPVQSHTSRDVADARTIRLGPGRGRLTISAQAVSPAIREQLRQSLRSRLGSLSSWAARLSSAAPFPRSSRECRVGSLRSELRRHKRRPV